MGGCSVNVSTGALLYAANDNLGAIVDVDVSKLFVVGQNRIGSLLVVSNRCKRRDGRPQWVKCSEDSVRIRGAGLVSYGICVTMHTALVR